jgi:polyhydroxyalkanoic acid synthase PhaR subunit
MEKQLDKDPTQKTILDPYKVWKQLYFSAEDTMSSNVKKAVNTGEFANGIEFILNSYLQYLKMHNEYISRYMKDSPFSSKYDVARVAELVVALENKLDGLESDFGEKLSDIENNTQLIAEQLAEQPKPASTEVFASILSPSMATLNDLNKRLGDLEIVIKQLDTKLTDMNQPINPEAKKKPANSQDSKNQKSTPKAKGTE